LLFQEQFITSIIIRTVKRKIIQEESDMDELNRGTAGGWVKHPVNPLLGGEYGTCFDISMLYEDGIITMYFSWREQKSIAMCQSKDGIHWSTPRFCIQPRATTSGWEDDLNRPSVVKRGGIYRMWYTGQHHAGQTDGTSHIFYAASKDGVIFERTDDNLVLSPELPWEKQAVMCPGVLWDEDKQLYKMWYSGGEQHEPNAIGYAESIDGIQWEKSRMNPIFHADPASSWERHKVAGCQVMPYQNGYLMFYIGFRNEDYAQIGAARSADGITSWKRSKHNPIIAPDKNAWDGEACYKPFVLRVNGQWMLWYNGRNGQKEQIGLATHSGDELFL